MPRLTSASFPCFSPHTYGPAVAEQQYFHTPDFPSNLPGIWDRFFGFVERHTGRAVVMGEWGGPLSGRNEPFEETLANYLISRCMSDNFYWVSPRILDSSLLLLSHVDLKSDARSSDAFSVPEPGERGHWGLAASRLVEALQAPPGPAASCPAAPLPPPHDQGRQAFRAGAWSLCQPPLRFTQIERPLPLLRLQNDQESIHPLSSGCQARTKSCAERGLCTVMLRG